MYYYYMLLWNGDVVPCCVDFNSTMIIHNVQKENLNLNDLFYSLQYAEHRKNMENLQYRNYPLCQRCGDYYRYITPQIKRG